MKRRNLIMKMTNMHIYDIANALAEQFQDKEIKLPVKVNFYLQKNKNVLISLGQELEKERINIIQKYADLDAETEQYVVSEDKTADAIKELNELFALEQEVPVYTVSIDALEGVDFTAGQMEALLFMIED